MCIFRILERGLYPCLSIKKLGLIKCIWSKLMNQKSQNPFTRRNVVLGGAAAVAGVAASINQSQPVNAQSSESSQQQEIYSKRLQGKVAIVTGAARAIGRACAVSLAQAGADIAAVDILQDI